MVDEFFSPARPGFTLNSYERHLVAKTLPDPAPDIIVEPCEELTAPLVSYPPGPVHGESPIFLSILEFAMHTSDYRYAARSGASLSARPIEIPTHVAEACTGMARSLGLALSGVDLRRTPDDQYYCFEINPSPGFIFYERAAGQPISEAVAHLLKGTM